MSDTTQNLPKAAAALVADARAEGMVVTVNAWGAGVDVIVEHGTKSINVTWTTQQHGGARGGGCNFYTSSGKSGVRFSHASGYWGLTAKSINSVKAARVFLNLPV